MNTDTPETTSAPDSGAGTPLESGATAISHTVGPHYTQATAADAGEAIALDAEEMAAIAEPDYAVPGTHDIVDRESGAVLGPDEVIAVAQEENEGNTMVIPPQIHEHQVAIPLVRQVQQETQRDPEGPTGS
jgi:hypothetical protein